MTIWTRVLTKTRFEDLGPYGIPSAEGGYRARSLGNVNQDGTFVAGRQRVFTRVHLVPMLLEREVCTGWHVEGGGRIATGPTDVTS